MFTNKTKKNAN